MPNSFDDIGFCSLIGVTGTTRLTYSVNTLVYQNMFYEARMWQPVICIPRNGDTGTLHYPILLPNAPLECTLVHNNSATTVKWGIKNANLEALDDGAMLSDDGTLYKKCLNKFVHGDTDYNFTFNTHGFDTYRNLVLWVYRSEEVPAFTFYSRMAGENYGT